MGVLGVDPVALVVAVLVWRLPEPTRQRDRQGEARTDGADPTRKELAELVEERDLEPDPDLVLEGEQTRRSLVSTVGYLVRVRTNLILVFATSVANIFFAGVSTFGVLFVVRHYGVSRTALSAYLPVAGVGLLVGLIGMGRLADNLLARGRIPARIQVAAGGHVVAALVLFPAVLLTSLPLAVPLLAIGGGALAGAGPQLDAARLDVVHPDLWGRAEGVRTVVRTAAEGMAPLALGWLATVVGGPDEGLGRLAVILLPALLVNAAVLWLASRHYAVDVDAVVRSIQPSDHSGSPRPSPERTAP